MKEVKLVSVRVLGVQLGTEENRAAFGRPGRSTAGYAAHRVERASETISGLVALLVDHVSRLTGLPEL
jgi:hypothetical protein